MGSLAFALAALNQISALMEAGAQVKQLVDDTTSKLQAMQKENRDPTPDEWSSLNGQVDALRATLHAA